MGGLRVLEDFYRYPTCYQHYYRSGVRRTISTLATYYLRFHSQNSDGTVDGIPGLRLLQDYISVEDEVRGLLNYLLCMLYVMW